MSSCHGSRQSDPGPSCIRGSCLVRWSQVTGAQWWRVGKARASHKPPSAPSTQGGRPLAADGRISVLAARLKVHLVLINRALKRTRESLEALGMTHLGREDNI